MILYSWVLFGGGSQEFPLGHLGSELGHSRSLTPQSHVGSPQVSTSTIATHYSFVNIAAAAAWETGKESPSFFFFFLLFFHESLVLVCWVFFTAITL